MNYLFKISSEYAILELGIGICRINEKMTVLLFG